MTTNRENRLKLNGRLLPENRNPTLERHIRVGIVLSYSTTFRQVPAPALSQQNRSMTVCRSEEHTSELQSLMRISYAVFCLKKKTVNISLLINTIEEQLDADTDHHSRRTLVPLARMSEHL